MGNPIRNTSMPKLTSEEIKSLPPTERAVYYERFIYDFIIRYSEDGLTVSELENKSDMSFATLEKYLKTLLSKRRIYKIQRGSMIIYRPNGRVLHSYKHKDILSKDGKRKFSFELLNLPPGNKSIYIMEKEIGDDGIDELVGGVTIPLENLADLKEVFEEITKTDTNVEG